MVGPCPLGWLGTCLVGRLGPCGRGKDLVWSQETESRRGSHQGLVIVVSGAHAIPLLCSAHHLRSGVAEPGVSLVLPKDSCCPPCCRMELRLCQGVPWPLVIDGGARGGRRSGFPLFFSLAIILQP